jgi:hypothetical protein
LCLLEFRAKFVLFDDRLGRSMQNEWFNCFETNNTSDVGSSRPTSAVMSSAKTGNNEGGPASSSPPQDTDPPGPSINVVNDASQRIRYYPSDFKGKFLIYIREFKKPLPHVTISSYLCKKYSTSILEIVKVHKRKIRVEANSAFTANLVVADKQLTNDYRVSIPADAVEINGIISLSQDLDVQDLIDFGKGIFGNPVIPNVSIVDAFRLSRTYIDHDGISVTEDSDQVRVTFKGTALPKMAVIYGLRVPVRLFKNKLMFCDKCQCFNHTAKFCTSSQKCARCGEIHDAATCQKIPKCPMCSKNVIHANRKDCPEYKKRFTSLNDRNKSRSRQAYSDLVKSFTFVHENPYSTGEESEDDVVVPDDKSSYADILSSGKRSRKSSKTSKRNPPKRRPSVNPGAGSKSQKSTTDATDATNGSASTSNDHKHRKKAKSKKPSAESSDDDWTGALRASILEFIESIDLPPFWVRIISSLASRVLDFLLPKISSLFSHLLSTPPFNG